MFATALSDAITASLVEGMNPMNQIAKQMFTSQASASELELDKQRKLFVAELRSDLATAISNSEDEEVIAGLRRLIQKHTAKQ